MPPSKNMARDRSVSLGDFDVSPVSLCLKFNADCMQESDDASHADAREGSHPPGKPGRKKNPKYVPTQHCHFVCRYIEPVC